MRPASLYTQSFLCMDSHRNNYTVSRPYYLLSCTSKYGLYIRTRPKEIHYLVADSRDTGPVIQCFDGVNIRKAFVKITQSNGQRNLTNKRYRVERYNGQWLDNLAFYSNTLTIKKFKSCRWSWKCHRKNGTVPPFKAHIIQHFHKIWH